GRRGPGGRRPARLRRRTQAPAPGRGREAAGHAPGAGGYRHGGPRPGREGVRRARLQASWRRLPHRVRALDEPLRGDRRGEGGGRARLRGARLQGPEGEGRRLVHPERLQRQEHGARARHAARCPRGRARARLRRRRLQPVVADGQVRGARGRVAHARHLLPEPVDRAAAAPPRLRRPRLRAREDPRAADPRRDDRLARGDAPGRQARRRRPHRAEDEPRRRLHERAADRCDLRGRGRGHQPRHDAVHEARGHGALPPGRGPARPLPRRRRGPPLVRRHAHPRRPGAERRHRPRLRRARPRLRARPREAGADGCVIRGASGGGAGTAARPNVLWVMADQLRYHALGRAGEPLARTPHIDRLAAEGVWCENAVSHYPVCMPYRAGLVTGLRPARNGVLRHGDFLPPGVPTVAHAFAAAGYRTSWVGKWHLAPESGAAMVSPQGWAGQDFWVHPALRGGFQDWFGFNIANNYYETYVCEGEKVVPRRLPGYQTDALTDLSLAYLAESASAAPDEPWFHVVSYESPHPGAGANPRSPGFPVPESYEALF